MRKLIDAEELKRWIPTQYDRYIYGQYLGDTIIDKIDALPDAGCARGQAHSGTQWCAEVVEMQREIERLKAQAPASVDTDRGRELVNGCDEGDFVDWALDGVPALCDEVDRLRAECERLRACIARTDRGPRGEWFLAEEKP